MIQKLEHTCEACHLPEDGCRVRNVTHRPSGNCSCADCTSLARASTINKEESHAQSPA